MENNVTTTDRIGEGLFTTLVLVEEKNDMWLATVRFKEPPTRGMTFHYRNQVWQVVSSETCGCRAEPAVM